MDNETRKLTNLDPSIEKKQNELRTKYAKENQIAKTGQIDFVGSSLMEIFPIVKMQADLNLDKTIYNRGVRATTTADLLANMDTLIFDLKPSKIFINIGSNDIGFGIAEQTFLKNYDQIFNQIKRCLPNTRVYAMAYFPVNQAASFSGSKKDHQSLFKTRSTESMANASKEVQKLAEKHGYQFIDVNKGLTDKDGNLRQELTFDGAHMMSSGYKIVLRNMLPFLEE